MKAGDLAAILADLAVVEEGTGIVQKSGSVRSSIAPIRLRLN